MKCAKCKNAKVITIHSNMFYCEVLRTTIYECSDCKYFKGKNKYNAKKTITEFGTFDSQKEATRFFELKKLQEQGFIHNLECQKKYEIVPKTKDERAVYYIADFVYEQDGKTIAEDVKSKITKKNPTYILKRKLFKYKYSEIIFKEV